MLTDADLERMFAARNTPDAGRQLIRRIRETGPVRSLQGRMDTVRTRYVSRKMDRALYAESRTVEFPGLYMREHDATTLEYWPQPVELDIKTGAAGKGGTRVQHTPDLFIITTEQFVVEEWREEARLLRLAMESPDRFWKDDDGRWHYGPVEEHLTKLGIDYRLRSADEHPRVLLSNLQFLEDYTLESTPVVPDGEAKRLQKLLGEVGHMSHLELIGEHGFSADHVFQLVLSRDVYVDLHDTILRKTAELTIYANETVGKADAVLRRGNQQALPSSAMPIRVGQPFMYDGKPLKVAMLGTTSIIARDADGVEFPLGLQLVSDLFKQQMLEAGASNTLEPEANLDEVIVEQKKLSKAIERLEALQAPEASGLSERTLRRMRAKVAGVTSPQAQLEALMPELEGNRNAKLPAKVIEVAKKALKHHNTPACPTVKATFHRFLVLCEEEDVIPMSQSSFYEWVKGFTDVRAREGRRKAKAQAPIPLTYDYEHPVHGVLPHEVVYCDHTILNLMTKGMVLPELGKPVLTLMVDGAMTKPRAFYLSYQPAGNDAVLMCLRDYVRRNGRLPRVLVLDNGKEFHSVALKQFCSMFGIAIRWRRRSTPRDSTVVERMLGASEQEVISALAGNSIKLKDPRSVSSSHLPDKHIAWTLPARHGALEHYFFKVMPQRIHPRLGMTPDAFEQKCIREMGAREHLMVRYDMQFKLLTAPNPATNPVRAVDRQRGVYVDGIYYWNDRLGNAKAGESVEVRVEPWNARLIYINLQGAWICGQARDGGRLNGRFRYEQEVLTREERRRKKTAANNDKGTVKHAKNRVLMWEPEHWDERLREQMSEAYYIYHRLGMTEVMPEATNALGTSVALPLPRGSDMSLIHGIEAEPDVKPVSDAQDDADEAAPAPSPDAKAKVSGGRKKGSTSKPSAPKTTKAAAVPPASSLATASSTDDDSSDYF